MRRRRSPNEICCVSILSIKIRPFNSAIRNNAAMIVLFPAPVLPTIPI